MNFLETHKLLKALFAQCPDLIGIGGFIETRKLWVLSQCCVSTY